MNPAGMGQGMSAAGQQQLMAKVEEMQLKDVVRLYNELVSPHPPLRARAPAPAPRPLACSHHARRVPTPAHPRPPVPAGGALLL